MADLGLPEFIKLAIYFAGYLYFPAALYLAFLIARRGPATKLVSAGALLVLSILAYARFIEPRILLTVEHEATLSRCFPEAGSARLAIFSDTHEGLFANAMPIRRIAARVNAAQPDAVFIAGDFVYFLDPARHAETFAALAGIRAPVFAVLGNHDVGLPGPDVGAPLTFALKTLDVRMIDDMAQALDVGGERLEVVGLSDLWAESQNRKLLENRGETPRLVLTHNPTTILELRQREAVDLMIAGHTHGGQINIPFITCALTSACRVARYGLLETDRGLLFVTSGTGMVGLPLRFNTPPRIDVIDLSWRACK